MNPKKKYIADLAPGDQVDEVFVLAEKSMGHKRDGNPYLTVSLSDRSGTVKGVVWDDVQTNAEAAGSGDFVRVRGGASQYRGTLQLTVRQITAVSADAVDAADFLPATSRDVDQMWLRLKAQTDTISDPDLAALFKALWADDQLVEQFKTAPAAKRMHHAYVGGLLEHTLSMALLVDRIAGHYGGIDRDLLLTGAVLHDIGKTRELSYRIGIDYTDEGRLLSHIVIGVQMVDDKLRGLPQFPAEKAVMVKHLIISHHGAREFGSPELPKTIEAVLLNYIDEIDSRVNSIREFMAAEAPDESWTAFHRLLERQFFKGPAKPAGS